ncbi:hypothetical protein BO82DRAFT_150680 [Aspergillus uvarum CBS 121591]|uniref:Uncharacterized protein n=1 Tax=Aspergillus uvarum CBS 121591 TaxID=1448315 RepID=A0A319DGQ6_9EURO|nr:hypothetical protein BO82DRAFT_150680 [Aspergillus uvarum CBS 121591]PYH78862.1 hypothetical protein BO82DRAFT_150680 [Aspergillus uvarum CBS 121591]
MEHDRSRTVLHFNAAPRSGPLSEQKAAQIPTLAVNSSAKWFARQSAEATPEREARLTFPSPRNETSQFCTVSHPTLPTVHLPLLPQSTRRSRSTRARLADNSPQLPQIPDMRGVDMNPIHPGPHMEKLDWQILSHTTPSSVHSPDAANQHGVFPIHGQLQPIRHSEGEKHPPICRMTVFHTSNNIYKGANCWGAQVIGMAIRQGTHNPDQGSILPPASLDLTSTMQKVSQRTCGVLEALYLEGFGLRSIGCCLLATDCPKSWPRNV